MNIPDTMPPREEWVTLSDELVARLVEGSRLRDGYGGVAPEGALTREDGSKRGDASPHSANLLGDLAEAIYSETTGLTMNEDVVVGGVKGDDFEDGINVKASPFINERCCLLINPKIKASRLPSRGYSLVAVAQGGDKVIGCILGWASNAEVAAAELLDVGYGPKHAIHHTKLHRPRLWLERGAFAREVPEFDPIMQDLLDML